MAIATPPLTYEQYLAEKETLQRYDILDGVRIIMNPTPRHQEILGNIYACFRAYQKSSSVGKAYMAPRDVLITRQPLRTRQPDVLFISSAQLARCAPRDVPAPMEAAPELVVEILSPSDTRRVRQEKIEDYRSIGVQECWVVSPRQESVEMLRLMPDGVETAAIYGSAETVQSLVFPGLTVSVAEIFAE